MASTFDPIRHTKINEPVTAAVDSRAARALEARTNYLKDALARIEAGRALLLENQRVDSTVALGQPVFWNTVTQQFEAALATVTNDLDSGTLIPNPSCDCIGLCYRKSTSVLGDIVLGGVVPLDMSNAIDGTIATGRYYLSSALAGKLAQQRPPVSVPVCVVLGPLTACETSTYVYVLPQLGDFLENHIHYRFELYCMPAGLTDQPLPGMTHTITDADAESPGWLPADDPSFAGNAPAGAVFGYNLAAHPEVARVWPPVPLESAVLFWDRGYGQYGATEIPTTGAEALVKMDRYGIWWMSGCYDDVPWPTWYDNIPPEYSLPSEELSSEVLTCPRPERMRLILGFVHMLFATQHTVVTSLHTATDSPISFVNCDGAAATTGDLWAQFDLTAVEDSLEYAGSRAFKQLVGPGLKFGLGRITEGLIADSEYVQITGEYTRLLDPDSPAGVDNPTVHQGLVHINVTLEPGEREIAPQIVRLADAMERIYADVPYLGFPQSRDSEIRLRLNIPVDGLPADPQLKIRVMLFGSTTGALPAMGMTYQRLARPVTGTPTVIAAGDTTVDFATTAVAVTAYNAIEIESDAIVVAPGDTILLSVTRASAAGYIGEVGIVRITGIVTATA
jgi:hypothetical protein